MARLKLPNGQYLRIPEGATQEDVDAAIASLPENMRKADFSDVTSTVSTQKLDPDYDKMTVGENFADAPRRFKEAGRGIWHSLKGTGRGAQQIAATLMGDDARMAELQAEEAAARETLSGETQGFRDANIMGQIMQSAVPAAGGAGVAARIGGGAARLAAAEGAIGGAQAALNPIVEGESRQKNVATGAAIGAALPLAGAAVRRVGDVAEFAPFIGGRVSGRRMRLAGELRAEGQAARQAVADENRAAVEAFKRQKAATGNSRQVVKEQFAGKQKALMQRIGREFSMATDGQRIPVPNKKVDALRSIQRRYGEDLPPEFSKLVDDMALASEHGAAKGEMLQQAKSALGDRARGNARRGLPSTGLHEAERVMADTILDGLPARRAAALRTAYGRYAKVANAKPVLPKAPLPPTPKQLPAPRTQPKSIVDDVLLNDPRSPALRSILRSLRMREEETER